MYLIGISAKMGCGKTHLTGHLIALLGNDWKRVSLGDSVKEEAAETFKFPLDWCYSQSGKNTIVSVDHPDAPSKKMTVRAILQWWGTDVRRAEQEDYWVIKGLEKIINLFNQGFNVIVDDIRFPDELAMISDSGGKNVRINAYPEYEPNPATKDHPSETALDNLSGNDWYLIISPAYGKLKVAADYVYQHLKENHIEDN